MHGLAIESDLKNTYLLPCVSYTDNDGFTFHTQVNNYKHKSIIGREWSIKLAVLFDDDIAYFDIIPSDLMFDTIIVDNTSSIDLNILHFYVDSSGIMKFRVIEDTNELISSDVSSIQIRNNKLFVLGHISSRCDLELDVLLQSIDLEAVDGCERILCVGFRIEKAIDDNAYHYESCFELDLICSNAYKINIVLVNSTSKITSNICIGTEETIYDIVTNDIECYKIITIRHNGDAIVINNITSMSDLCSIVITSLYYIEGCYYGKVKYEFYIRDFMYISELIIKNRSTCEQYELPMKSGNNNVVEFIVDFDKTFKSLSEGKWDVLALVYNKNVHTAYEYINVSVDSSISQNLYFLMETISEYCIRPYTTLDGNLSFLLRYDLFKHYIKSVDIISSSFLIQGMLLYKTSVIPTIDCFYLKIEEMEHLINTEYSQVNEDVVAYGLKIDTRNINQEGTHSLYVKLNVNNKYYECKIMSNTDDIYQKNISVCLPHITRELYRYQPLYGKNNEFMIEVSNTWECFCTKFKINKKTIVINGFILFLNDLVSYDSLNAVNLVLIDDEKKHSKIKMDYSIDKNRVRFCAMIEIDRLLKDMNEKKSWDAFIMLDYKNIVIKSKINGNNSSYILKNSIFRQNAKRILDNLYISAFFSSKYRVLCIELRSLKEYEKQLQKFKFKLSKILAFFYKLLQKQQVWLVGENLGEVAQDNGFAFFEYCYDKSEKVCFISKKDNAHINKLQPYYDKVILYNTFKHMLYYNICRYIIVSHGIRDAIPEVVHNVINKNSKPIIYLQHGIIALKKLYFNGKSYNNKIEKFVVSSQHERDILINDMKFQKKQIMITGLSRYDKLTDSSQSLNEKVIFVFPTWREWIINSVTEFLDSDFYKYYSELLKNNKLHSLLDNNQLILKFYPHIEIQKKYIDYFTSSNKRIKIVDIYSESIQDLIRESSLMITDYSSVSLDFNFLEKPVLFFQFDINDYMRCRGSYINLRKDLFGDVAYEVDELVSHIEQYTKNNFIYKDVYRKKSRRFYDYFDRNNSERIYLEVKKN